MISLNGNDFRTIFSGIRDNIVNSRDMLTGLDSALGDGDLGITMCRGFEEVQKALEDFEDNDVGKILVKAGMVMAQTSPSTMGTLIATGFMKAGKAVTGKNEITLAGFHAMMEAFIEGIMVRGHAKPGDKTIIDALYPAVEELLKAVKEEKSIEDGLSAAYEATAIGAETTKGMIAKHGRPSYYGEKSIGKEDPGAAVGVLIMKAFAEYKRM
ncbi:MAG: dihydroxyacetone kinase subunit L [Candidatus Latescibacteria bacterium]|jgi:phosphoenolpyruvate---glycerone phosphotransferase subunit DhaL|nr:dihydroxyacetone kinase subunit L [Candidatus Latescibacterota bacterium]